MLFAITYQRGFQSITLLKKQSPASGADLAGNPYAPSAFGWGRGFAEGEGAQTKQTGERSELRIRERSERSGRSGDLVG
jgi:hypothetical protein